MKIVHKVQIEYGHCSSCSQQSTWPAIVAATAAVHFVRLFTQSASYGHQQSYPPPASTATAVCRSFSILGIFLVRRRCRQPTESVRRLAQDFRLLSARRKLRRCSFGLSGPGLRTSDGNVPRRCCSVSAKRGRRILWRNGVVPGTSLSRALLQPVSGIYMIQAGEVIS